MSVRLATLALLAAAVLVLPPCGRAAEKKREEKQVGNKAYPAEFQVRVNQAIDDGVRWLKARQRPDGSWKSRYHNGYPMGPTALATLTLLKGGVPRDAPCIQRAFDYLRKLPMRKTYSVGILLMALDAKYAPARDPFAVESTDRYGNVTAKKDPCAKLITLADKQWMKAGVKFLLEQQTSSGVWRYPTAGDFDLSNTQYALLGLQAATRCAVKVRRRVFLDALKFLLDHQEAVGRPVVYEANEVRGRYRFEWTEPATARGFRYKTKRHPISGAMTTAGLAGLIICQGALWKSRSFTGKLRKRTREGIRDSMAWMQEFFDVTRNPVEPSQGVGDAAVWHYYYLYGLERAGVLGRIRNFGKIDWYFDGALYLIDNQDKSWLIRGSLEDSCFAILFLKRATTHVNAPVITPRANDPNTPFK